MPNLGTKKRGKEIGYNSGNLFGMLVWIVGKKDG